MGCDLCSHCPSYDKELFPAGSLEPDYYILGDMANQTDIDSEMAFSTNTPEGQFLFSTMNSLGFDLGKIRYFKIVRCLFSVAITDETGIRENCMKYAMADIFKTKPKVIITLGKEVTSKILKDKFSSISKSRGRLYDVEINGENFKVLPTYSPNFILNNPGANDLFFNDFKQAKSYISGDLIDIDKKNLTYATDYETFSNYYETHMRDAELPAYDLETNARDSRSIQAKMCGFSLAPNGDTGIYVVRNSLEYNMPEEDWENIRNQLIDMLKTKRVLVHNSMYEIPFTLNELNVMITEFEDSLVKARLLLGGKTGADLKGQCQRNLGYPDWDSDVGDYRNAFMGILGDMSPTPKGNARWDYTFMRNGGIPNLLEYYEDKQLDDRSMRCYKNLTTLRDLLIKYYPEDTDFSIIIEILCNELIALIDSKFNDNFSYAFIPMRIIAKYGAMDAVGTHDLNNYLNKRMTELSAELGIDLFKGYYYIKCQFIAGIQMEINGLYWNDEVAEEELNWYKHEAKQAALEMINSPFLDDFLVENNLHILNDYVVENMMDYVHQRFGELEFKRYYFIIKSIGKQVKYKDTIYELGNEFIKDNRGLLLKLIRDQAAQMDSYVELKKFFNPASPLQKYKDLLNNILMSPHIQLAHFMSRLLTIIDDPSFNIDRYPSPDRDILQILIDCRTYNKLIQNDEITDKELMDSLRLFEEFEDDISSEDEEDGGVKKIKLSSHETYEKFVKVLSGIQFRSYELQQLAGVSLNYRLDNTQEGTIIELFGYYSMTEIDVENPEVRTDKFKFLLSYRVWKKCNKLITTYINGNKVGRGSVWIIDEESYRTDKELTRRKRPYRTGKAGEGETTLLQTSYGVCTADSFRWRSGIHTIPAESSIKNIYSSRFFGGTMLAPDFSQMEVRGIAGLSKCVGMIEAFKNGLDIHTNNGCMIWKKTPETLTPAERRYAKMASFSILYGSTPYNFAMEYLGGDVPLAEEIFSSFYTAFPEIKVWIEKKHKEMHETGKVVCETTHCFLDITPDKFYGDVHKAERVAQNGPVQHTGSMMAGFVLYKIGDYIREHGLLSKICMFVHDSLEIDVHPMEFIELGSQIIPLMNKFPMDEFEIPTSADLIVGVSIGQELEIPRFEASSDYKEAILECHGFEDNFDAMIANWRKVYRNVEYVDLSDPKPFKIPVGDAFVPKKALNRYYRVGQRVKIAREVKLQI